jgi:allantoinase
LWRALLAGEIASIGSDHSPAPPEMKMAADFFQVWGGISGAQHLLALMITRGMEPGALARVAAGNVAKRFGLPESKGRIAVGSDADLAIIDLHGEFVVERESLFYRHRQSPYIGRRLRGATRRTLVRGRTVFHDGRIIGGLNGCLIRPVLS